MKKKNVITISLYVFGIILFVISNSSVVSGSPIRLEFLQRVILCSASVVSIGAAPFVCNTNRGGRLIKFIISAVLIVCVFAFGGFDNNRIA